MGNPGDIEKTVINVKGVEKPAWEVAKRGAAQTGDSMGKWLSEAVYLREKIDAGAIQTPGLAAVKNGHDSGNPAMTEDQRSARIQAVAAMMQGLAAIKTATGRASGRDVVMQELWALDRRPPRVLIHNPPTALSAEPGDK